MKNAETPATTPREWAIACAWFLTLIVVTTWPVVSAPASWVIGDELSGCWRAIWGHWWTLERLETDGRWPLTAHEIAFPRNGPFSSIAPVNDALSLPLQMVFGLVPAYNLVVAFNLMLASTGAYALARQARTRHAGALVAGTVFGFNAFLLSYGVASAVAETQTIGWLAWFTVSVIGLVRSPSWRTVVMSAVLFSITALSSHYWALFAAMLAPFVGAAALVDRKRANRPVLPLRLVLCLCLAAGLAATIVFVPGRALMETYQAQGAVLQDYASRKQTLLPANVMAKHAHDLASFVGFLAPGKAQLAVHEDMDRLVQTTYAGWVALALALMGLGRGRRRWVVVALAGMVLACGPYLLLSPNSFQEDPVAWWVFLRDRIPVTRMITSYVRFSVFFFLGLSVLAGAGTDRLLGVLRASRFGSLGGAVCAAFVFADLFWLSPVPMPIPSSSAAIPSASRALADLPRPGAVLDWPQRYEGRSVEYSRYFYYQTAHGRPIPYDFAPTSYMPGPIEGNPFFAELERLTYGDAYSSQAWGEEASYPVRRGLMELEQMGFAYLAVHLVAVPSDRVRALAGWLDARLYPVVGVWSEGTVVFEIRAPDY